MRSVRCRLRFVPRRRVALSAGMAVLALAAPVSGASAAITPVGFGGAGTAFTGGGLPSCQGSYAPSGLGDAGATDNQFCGGLVLAFVGPSIGQIGAPIGPTIIGSSVTAPVTVSSGPVGFGSVP
jgi:hypothetical protein